MTKRKYLKDIPFYKMALAIALPMIGANFVTNFVSMIDNIMIGSLGTNQMNAVSIINQYILIFNLTIFGGLSGPSIFGTQFFGRGDYKGQKQTFCYRLILCLFVTIVAILLFLSLQDILISLFISSNSDEIMKLETINYAKEYLFIILFSLLPFSISQAYTTLLRESGETRIPFVGSLSAIGINIIFNYLLIFGKLGFPVLGVKGAAIATVMAKIFEMVIIIVLAHKHSDNNPALDKFYEGFKIQKDLFIEISKKSWPLLINEFLWSLGNGIISQAFSSRGLDVVAARNIFSTLTSLFVSVYAQLGAAAGIILGQDLGKGDFNKAIQDKDKLLLMAEVISVILIIISIPLAFLFPNLYNTTSEIKNMAVWFIIIYGLCTPIFSATNLFYFALRSGGKTFITFLYDFLGVWVVQIPLAIGLCYFTEMNIITVSAIVYVSEIIKTIIGYFMVRSGIWLVKLNRNEETIQDELLD